MNIVWTPELVVGCVSSGLTMLGLLEPLMEAERRLGKVTGLWPRDRRGE